MKLLSKSKIKFRRARNSDLDSVLLLYSQLHMAGTIIWFGATNTGFEKPGNSARIWKEMLADRKLYCLLAETGGKVVATCTLVVVPNLTRGGRSYCLVENVVTDSSFRRMGIGIGLLKHALLVAKSKGCYKAMLMTGSKRKAVHKFYQQAGFEKGLKTAFVARIAS